MVNSGAVLLIIFTLILDLDTMVLLSHELGNVCSTCWHLRESRAKLTSVKQQLHRTSCRQVKSCSVVCEEFVLTLVVIYFNFACFYHLLYNGDDRLGPVGLKTFWSDPEMLDYLPFQVLLPLL